MALAPRRPTLRDLSAAANVSLYTASRALGEFPDVAEGTRARVRAVAASLGYVPNQVARSLRASASRTLGVLTANNANAYYAKLVRSFNRTVGDHGYQCFEVDATEGSLFSRNKERLFVASLMEQRVAGVVLTYVPDRESMGLLARWGMPLVFVDCRPPDRFSAMSSVIPDNHRASLEVGRHFARLGYRRWLFLGHSSDWTSRKDRELGFLEAARACGAEVDVVEGGNDHDACLQALRRSIGLLDRAKWPRAVFASNEPLLNGAIRFLRETETRVPDEVAVVGFDEFEWADAMKPALTVVDQRIAEIGTIAGVQMLDAIAGRPASTRVVEPRLVVRESCGTPHSKST